MIGIRMLRRTRRPPLTAPPSGDAYQSLILADNPALYLPLDGTADGRVDQTGNGHTASVVGTLVAATGPPGSPGSTRFNPSRTGDTVSVANNVDLSIDHTGKLTFELWLSSDDLEFEDPPYLRQGSGAGYLHLFGKGDTGQDEYVLRQYPTSDSSRSQRLSSYAFNLSGGLGTGAYDQPTAPEKVREVGDWTHVVAEYDMTVLDPIAYPGVASDLSGPYPGWVRIYVNGVLRDIDPFANYETVPEHGTHPLRIGSSSTDSYFPGRICDVAVYNHLLGPRKAMQRFRQRYPLTVGAGGLVDQLGSAVSTTSGTTLAMNTTEAVASGDMVVVGVFGDYTSSSPTVTGLGGTWTRFQNPAPTDNTSRLALFRATLASGVAAGGTITATWSTSVTRKVMVAGSVTGVDDPVTVDVQATKTAASATDTSENPSDVDANESPFVDITTDSPATIIVAALGLQASGAGNVFQEDDPEAWALVGVASTTGGTVALEPPGSTDRSILMAVRSVPAQGDYTFAGTSLIAGRWVGAATSFLAG